MFMRMGRTDAQPENTKPSAMCSCSTLLVSPNAKIYFKLHKHFPFTRAFTLQPPQSQRRRNNDTGHGHFLNPCCCCTKREDVEERGEEESVQSRNTRQRQGGKQENETGGLWRERDCLKQQIRMFLLIWVTSLFSMQGRNAARGASMRGSQHCEGGFCATFSKGEITAEAGLSVAIPCSFIASFGFIPQNLVWYKCEPTKQRCGDSDIIFHTNKNNMKVQSGFRGRVSLLEPDLRQRNCSIIISDLVESDSGSYQLRVNGIVFGRTDEVTFSARANVSVKGPVRHCGPDSAVLPWAIAGVSLSVNICYTICVVFLWKARKKLKPNQEDRVYMSLQKTDRSPEYDVIQTLN